ncbi:MAG TPA: CvpA family protein [Candidatus Limihabitans stercoravium]|nr:CvpA family protein [Candidatus Limihabitans stercoravium]
MDIVGIVFVVSALFWMIVGLVDGFADQIFRVIGGIVSMVVATLFYGYVSQWFVEQGWIKDQYISVLIGWIVVMFASCVVFGLIGWLVRRLLKWAKPLNVLDRLLGLVFAGCVVYAVFGALYYIAGITIDAGNMTDAVRQLQSYIADSNILNTVYGSFNPIGQLMSGFIA